MPSSLRVGVSVLIEDLDMRVAGLADRCDGCRDLNAKSRGGFDSCREWGRFPSPSGGNCCSVDRASWIYFDEVEN
jgi:hypothetical protein